MVSFHYEIELLNTNMFHLKFNAGFGLNENGDDQTEKSAIYGFHTSLVGLFGKNKLFLETSLFPTTYFNGPTTFINLNGWIGLKYDPFYNSTGPFISVGYTPRIFTSYSGTDYLNIPFALKLGINI